MNVATYLQRFESSLSSYTGDDVLDSWDKFVEFLEQKFPASSSEMFQVFDTLVQRFLGVDRYANDIRYVNYCIRCASYYSDPIDLYSLVFSKGVGTRTAALYLAWAQQFEQKGLNEQAEAVYQKAVENRAQPADTVLHEYRQFQSRTRAQLPASGGRSTLQDSQLTNQMPSHSVNQNQEPGCPSKPPANRMVNIVSRSETSGTLPAGHRSSVQTVSEYLLDDLGCDGSEFCFEEVRAKNYFRQLREKQEKEQRKMMEMQLRQQEDRVQRMKCLLEEVNQELETRAGFTSQTSPQQPFAAGTNLQPPQPRPSGRLSSRRSLSLRLQAEPAFIHKAPSVPDLLQECSEVSQHPSALPDGEPEPEPVLDQMNPSLIRSTDVLHQSSAALSAAHLDGSRVPEPEDKLDVSQGGTANVSHVTPNNSLGFVQATPSRVLPSPTVNTREALGVIMDMFQAPTFLEDPLSSTSVLRAAERDRQGVAGGGISSAPKPPTPAFTIYQDDDKENCSSAAPSEKPKAVRALTEVSVPKSGRPNETGPDLMPDESTMWGPRYNSLAACPNSTTDFALLAQFVSTPFTHKTPFDSNFFQDQESRGDGGEADENVFIRRQTKKLSPIMEQSPADTKGSESAVVQLPPSVRQGTIVGEGLTTTSSTTLMQPPPGVLSFRDQTLCSTESSRSAVPGWEVYTSPEQPPEPEDLQKPGSPEPDQNLDQDVPLSPECAPKPSWLQVRSPEAAAQQDLDVFLSPCRPETADRTSTGTSTGTSTRTSTGTLDVPMSPEQPGFCADVPMSPQQTDAGDELMIMSPDRGPRRTAETQLVSDPWDNNLISELLSRLRPPLTSDPRCFTWQRDVPKITPKVTISVGKASLRVDCVLGKGAFATVYQATDPVTSEKLVLKVQKPANPWEFYINAQLDARLQPDRRHLFGSVRSAHLFHDGSVLLGELHNYGTLLNAVNICSSQCARVMPQPLVLYFAACMLHMVEQLHAARIIHADIKPDNFMLGERFLENECLDLDSVDHGLVLIDLGQSIDMKLFPEGTAFTARCLTSGFQCTEMLSGKPWTYQTDYFGLAGTVYCLLFGSYMQVTEQGGAWTTSRGFRRIPHSDVWVEFFHTLLNVPDCGSLQSLQNLRGKLVSVLQQNYSNKLPALKRRLVVQLLERR
ncbi:mitotic checkpoint serine/threonine-protein kinase BUB1 isoform X2 [Kryptolebias marmoratus]|uniref:BUB1 mitotic checkpoint serine/threonine kinase n=1 Tax=Kryptolebias marmoratus TaxID=37003 RepID=A0A3Q3BG29_KRYMA|nr:mitotic checkpoint serine/threonine-protein kinase BUB1 isoform X2 [Kryptolebias marmoratus]